MLKSIKSPTETKSETDDMDGNSCLPMEFYHATSVLLSDRQKRVARMIGHGFNDLTIAEACGLESRAVQEIRNRPEVLAYVARLRALARLEVIEQKDLFDELLHKSIRTYEKVLDDPTASAHLRVKVASEVLDRHPDGQFVRGQKTIRQTRPVMDSESIARLKANALQADKEIGEASVKTVLPRFNQ